ncbi:MAG: hypothetical protein MJ169_08155 [Treponema sp.]|nr:hypothetical protein [Treponema sp.]
MSVLVGFLLFLILWALMTFRLDTGLFLSLLFGIVGFGSLYFAPYNPVQRVIFTCLMGCVFAGILVYIISSYVKEKKKNSALKFFDYLKIDKNRAGIITEIIKDWLSKTAEEKRKTNQDELIESIFWFVKKIIKFAVVVGIIVILITLEPWYYRGNNTVGTLGYTRMSGISYFIDFKPEYQCNGIKGFIIPEIEFETVRNGESFPGAKLERIFDEKKTMEKYYEYAKYFGHNYSSVDVEISRTINAPLKFAEITRHGTYIVIPAKKLF